MLPSLSGFASQVMRPGGISYMTYTILRASSLNCFIQSTYPGRSAGDSARAPQLTLAGPGREQVDALNDRNFVPVHHLLLQRPVERRVLVRGQDNPTSR